MAQGIHCVLLVVHVEDHHQQPNDKTEDATEVYSSSA